MYSWNSRARSPVTLVSHPMTKKSAGACCSSIPFRTRRTSAVDSCLVQCIDTAVTRRPSNAARTTATREDVVLQAFSTSALAGTRLRAASSAPDTVALKISASTPRGTSTIVCWSPTARKLWYLFAIAGKSQSARPSCTQMIDAPVLLKYRVAAVCLPGALFEKRSSLRGGGVWTKPD